MGMVSGLSLPNPMENNGPEHRPDKYSSHSPIASMVVDGKVVAI
jgi:hypothetical protein